MRVCGRVCVCVHYTGRDEKGDSVYEHLINSSQMCERAVKIEMKT